MGEVPIEDKNHKYVKDSIKDSRWILRFDSVIYGKDKIILPMQTVRFKIELGIIVGPESYLNFILNDFFDEYIKKTLCDYKEVIGSNFNMFTCKESIVDTYFYDSFPKLEFFFRGKSIVFISSVAFMLVEAELNNPEELFIANSTLTNTKNNNIRKERDKAILVSF